MRAAVVDRYGPPEVVRIAEEPRPAPGADEVVVEVVAAAVTSGDARVRAARFPAGFGPLPRLALGLTRPRRPVLGGCFSGRVAAVGAEVTDVRVGDEVCGMTGTRMGTHAEYVAVPARRVVPKPEGVTHEQAAGVLFGGTTALFFLRDKAGVRAGQTVLVIGASGAVGTNAVQLAALAGAEVTAVTSGRNAELVTQLGAQQVIDYTRTDLAALTDRFDVVVDTVGTLDRRSGRRLLADGGVLLLVVAGLWDTVTSRGDVQAGSAPERPEDMALLLGLVADGSLTVVVDEVVDLDGLVAAYQRIDSGHKAGNIVVRP